MMKMVKGLGVAALAVTLAACGGGPGSFEGEWKPKLTGEHAYVLGDIIDKQGILEIGDGYVMQGGQKVEGTKMELTEQNGKEYLSIQGEGGGMSFEIVDDDTLKVEQGPVAIVYNRV